jgi:hypothetical protein
MNLFTEVYDKSKDLLQKPCFDQRWSNIESKVKALFADGGFSEADAPVLDLIRQSLASAAKGQPDFGKAVAEEIVKLSRPGDAGFQDRAALIKTLKHIYFVARKGRQSIWTVDHPKAYDKWVYDKTNGLAQDKVKEQLARNHETFGSGNRAMFSDALQLARKISMDTCVKLAKDDGRTRRKIRKWFLERGASKEDVEKTRLILLDGFKKISALCNTNTVIFSDRPHKRVDPGYAKTKASVNEGDKMPVIYIFKMFLDYGAPNLDGVRDRLWQCAKTIIHEMSHKILSTDDHAYGVNGIRPGVSVTVGNAIKNADSWGIFALDVAGFLPEDAAKEAYS